MDRYAFKSGRVANHFSTTSYMSLLKLSHRSRRALDGKPEHDNAFDAHRDNAPVHDKRGAVVLVVDGFA